MRSAVCLFSGGPDSLLAAREVADDGYVLRLLTFLYGQKTETKELAASKELSALLGASQHITIDLSFLRSFGGSALTDPGTLITRDNLDAEYVPFRNSVFLSVAVALAEAAGASVVVTGSTGAPWITPDNSPAYYDAFQRLVNVGSRVGSALEVRAPYSGWTKRQVLERSLELGLPLELTWSCHNRVDLACGECSNCLDRLSAFSEIGIEDPIQYKKPDL